MALLALQVSGPIANQQWGATNSGNSTSNQFLTRGSQAAITTTESSGQIPSPEAFKLWRLAGGFMTASAQQAVLTVRVNGVSQSLTATIGTGTTPVISDLSSSIAVGSYDFLGVLFKTTVADATANTAPRAWLIGAVDTTVSTTWSPPDSSQTITWWRADLSTLVNGSGTFWTDQILGKILGAAPSIQPTINASDANFNNQSSLSFGGTQWMQLASSGLVQAQPRGYFFVMRMTNVTSGSLIDGADGSNRNNVLFQAGPHLAMYAGNAVPQSSVTPVINTVYAAFAVFNGASSYWRQNGTQSTAINLGATGTQGIQGIKLFNAGPGGGIGAGAIAELITFTAVPSASYIAQLETYAKARYALSF